jgi:hypothetical protein
MRTEKSTAEVLTIHDAHALDPITVYLQDFGTRGRITIECYGHVWTTYFGAYGTGTLPQFVAQCNMGYLLNRFLPQNLGVKALKSESAYLERILRAVVEVFTI